MSSVDDRIVNMEFNNKQFTQGVNQTERDLTSLEKSLARTGKSEGLTKMGSAAQLVTTKFSALQVAGVTAVATIANKAVMAGGRLLKSLTIDPIMQGFQEYQTNLQSVQTIMSNTGKSVKVVNSYLDELNTYADQTVYNFSEMARNIGTFTAAGVDLKTATASIKGIANLAALSGSNSQQASTAMYQLSQAIAAGRVGLQDWNSVVNAGMGGKIFQTALARTAQSMGDLGKNAIKLEGPMKKLTVNGEAFRQSISTAGGGTSWLSGEVLVDTLKQISGGYTDAQLKAKGFTDQQIKDIQKLARTAFDAATQIKTFPQLLSVIRESIGSTFAGAFRTIIGDFKQSKKLWGDVGFAIIGPSGFLTKIQHGFEETLKGWAKMGGRDDLLDGFKNMFKGLGAVVGTFRDAFVDIFPPATSKSLADMTQNFKEFTRNLIPSEETLASLSAIFKGFFSGISIGIQIIKGIAGVIGDLLGELTGGAGGFLEFAGGIGSMITAFDQALKEGEGLEKFFDGLSAVLSVPVKLLNAVSEAIFGIFGGFDEAAAGAVESSVSRIGDRLSPMAEFAQKARDALASLFENLAGLMGPVIDGFANFGASLAESFGSGSFEPVFDAINTGLFAGLIFLFKRFLDNGLSLNLLGGDTGGLIESIKDSFGALTGTLEAMQTKLKADALLRIAGAIAIMTLSVVALSLIDSKKLTSALLAMSVTFGMLLGSMAILEKVSTSAGFLKMPFITASMIMLSTAILILSAAVTVMSRLSWEELLRGLVGVAGALGAIALGMRLMPKGMVAQSAALMGLALALNGIALAISTMGQMTWEEISKGLATIAGALTGIAVAMRLMPKGILLQAAAILILSGALNAMAMAIGSMGNLTWEQIAKGIGGLAGALVLIAGAMHLMPKGMLLQAAALAILGVALQGIGKAIAGFANMSWESIGKGLAGIAGALVLIAVAMQLMPLTLPITAAGLVLVAFALQGIAAVVMSLSGMSWDEIAHGMVALGGALAVIAIGVNLMSGAVGGAAALLIVSAALAIFVPVLIALGNMSLESIGKGLAGLAAGFLILGAAGYFLGPSILLLGAGMALLGAGLALAGAGMLAFSMGFAILVGTGAAGIAFFLEAIDEFMLVLPKIAEGFGLAFVEIVQTIGENAPKVRKAMGQIIENLLGVVEDALPEIGDLISQLIETGLGVIEKGIPRYAEAGMKIIRGLIEAAERQVPKIADAALDLIETLIREVGKGAVRLARAGADMVVDVLNGLAAAVEEKGPEIRAAARNLASAFVEQVRIALAEMVPNIPIPDLPSPGSIIKGGLKALDPRGRVNADYQKKALTDSEKFVKGVMDFARAFKNEMANVATAITTASQLLVGASSGKAFNMAMRASGLQASATSAGTSADIQSRFADKAEKVAGASRNRLDNAKKRKGESAAHFKARRKELKADAQADQKAANKKRKLAEATAKRAADIQAQADAERQKAMDEAAIEQATKRGDFQAVGDIRSEQGQDLAAQAQEMMAQAQAKNAEAARLGKKNADAARKLREGAAKDAAAAQKLAEQANTAQAAAITAYGEARRVAAQSVVDRMQGLREQQQQEAAQRKWDKDYNEASDQGKIDMLQARITANEDKAATAQAELVKAYAAADALEAHIAAGGAVTEQQLADMETALAKAEENAGIAQQASDQAAQDAETIKQLEEKIAQDNASGGSSTGGGSITPSRTALEDAALAVDRYTASVAQAEEAAMAGAAAPQFVQNNYSPEALSASEIYRQSKNLVSAAEVKMGVPTG
jgi:tape measure domain-containing protein